MNDQQTADINNTIKQRGDRQVVILCVDAAGHTAITSYGKTPGDVADAIVQWLSEKVSQDMDDVRSSQPNWVEGLLAIRAQAQKCIGLALFDTLDALVVLAELLETHRAVINERFPEEKTYEVVLSGNPVGQLTRRFTVKAASIEDARKKAATEPSIEPTSYNWSVTNVTVQQ